VSRSRSSERPAEPGDRDTVAAAALRRPKVLPAAATVGEARTALADDHVHALLVVDDGLLLAVVEREDLEGRTVAPDADLSTTWAGMAARGRRRLAVVDERGLLVGLLCLKRSGRGFCSAADVAARARDPRTSIADPLSGPREA
jgi:CBS domain-containing protein